eukprot:SAG31_NODE_44320_length_263_cov_0.719512_1_plen_58_part_01
MHVLQFASLLHAKLDGGADRVVGAVLKSADKSRSMAIHYLLMVVTSSKTARFSGQDGH